MNMFTPGIFYWIFCGTIYHCFTQYTVANASNIGTFWHFTDIHLDTTYEIPDVTGVWGTYNRDTSLLVASTAILNATRLVGSFAGKPDFVIWSGDSAPHNTTLTADDVLKSIAQLSRWFRIAFPVDEIPLLPVIGARDLFPLDTISPHTGDLQREAWCTRLGTEPAYLAEWVQQAALSVAKHYTVQSKFAENCILSWLLPETDQRNFNLLLLGLNSLVWYVDNPKLEPLIDDPLNQFHWLRESLLWARKMPAKVILVSHLPPGTAELHLATGQYIHPYYNQQLVDILRTFSDVIITTLAGHEHVDTFRVVLDSSYNPVGTVFIGPSIGPRHMKEVGDFNPRLRVYQYDRDSAQILNYKQIWLDLCERHPAWIVDYEALEAYPSLRDLTATSLANLLDEFTAQDDPNGQWNLYWDNELGHRPHENKSIFVPGGFCPYAASVCRCEHICAMRHLEVSAWQSCLDSYCYTSIVPRLPTIYQLSHASGNGSHSVVYITMGVLCLMAFILFAVIFISRKRCSRRRTQGTPHL